MNVVICKEKLCLSARSSAVIDTHVSTCCENADGHNNTGDSMKIVIAMDSFKGSLSSIAVRDASRSANRLPCR